MILKRDAGIWWSFSLYIVKDQFKQKWQCVGIYRTAKCEKKCEKKAKKSKTMLIIMQKRKHSNPRNPLPMINLPLLF